VKPDVQEHKSSIDPKDNWDHCALFLANLMQKSLFRAFTVVVMLLYWGSALWGCLQLEVGITPEKLFLPSSPLARYFQLDNKGLHQSLTVYFFVSRPPNFSQSNETAKFLKLVTSLENLTNSLGGQTTMLFYRPYVNYLKFWDYDEHEDFYKYIDEFLKGPPGKRWQRYVNTSRVSNKNLNDTNSSVVTIDRFFFSTSFRAARSWAERSKFTVDWRQLVDSYQQFNVSIWDDEDENYITDQLDAIPGNTIQVFSTYFLPIYSGKMISRMWPLRQAVWVLFASCLYRTSSTLCVLC